MYQSYSDNVQPLKNSKFAHASAFSEVGNHQWRQDAEVLGHKTGGSISRRWWQTVGWPMGALGSAIMASASLLVNSIALIWILTTFKFNHGIAQVFAGSCHEAEKIDTWVNLGINALSTLLLSGSNYCMQILSAPTRKEIDKAHARKKWLDVGVPSVRNLKNVAVSKRLMWWLLGLSSIPLHLMYNSVFFSIIATNEYNIDYAHEAFLQGGPQGAYNETEFVGIEDIQAHAKSWDRLENADCINAYASEFLNTRRNLVAVILNKTTAENDSIKRVRLYRFQDSNAWICDAHDARSRYGFTTDEAEGAYLCSTILPKVKAHAERWNSGGYDIDYCLSEPVQGKCSLNFSLPIVVVVMICNVGKALTMFFIAFRIRDKPLITIGDAIKSFLEVIDPTTHGMCLVGRESIKAGASAQYDYDITFDYEHPYIFQNRQRISTTWKAGPVAYKSSFKRWFNSMSGLRWWTCMPFLFVCMVIVAALLARSISASGGAKSSPNGFIDLGIGAVHSSTIIDGMALVSIGGTTVIASVLVANVPQIILSFLYLLVNGIFTSMLLADEWSDFAHERKSLRVSDPKPGQRATYFLQLPHRYAVPLMTFSGVLHWSVSQSIFLAQVATFSSKGELIDPAAVSTCGHSPVAIMLTMIMLCCLAAIVIGLGLRSYKPGMPLAGTCSAAIAAACHPSSDIDTTAPLQWGVTSEDGVDVGHCAFSDRPVEKPREGALYAGLKKRDR